ncbi:MAG: hypothetical protein KF782_32395 [Labilithrix sp.]|nr:hypothetical protein [Labilithrix sp.]
MKTVRRASLMLALVALAACRRPDPAPPPASVEDAKSGADTRSDASPGADTSDGAVADTSDGATASGDAGAARSTSAPLPPSGIYTITLSERSSTCRLGDAGAADAGGEAAWVLVTPAPGRDGAGSADLPVNTGGGAIAVDRHDLRLAIGHVERSALRPDRTCAWEVSREMRVLEVSPTRIAVEVRAAYTDAVRCTLPRRPVSCERDVVLTYTLARPFCDSGCAAAMIRSRDGGVDARCSCP